LVFTEKIANFWSVLIDCWLYR